MDLRTVRSARGMRAVMATVLACAAAAASVQPLHAQPAPPYPVKPVRLIAPFPPGGSSDLIARVVAQKMSENLPGNVIIDNRPGAGSNLGTALAARAAPDGYTLLIVSVTGAMNMTLSRNPGYDLLKDFAPISTLAVGPTALVVHPSVPAKNVADLIRLAQAKPGALNYGSGGAGTPSHISGEMFRHMAKAPITHVPYKGTGQSVTDLLAGQIQLVFASMPVVMQHMKGGRLRTLAVTGAQRTPLAPDLPTVAESGIPGYAFDSWWGLVTNAGVPRRIVDQLNTVVRRGQQTTEVRDRFTELGIDVLHSSPEEFAAFKRSEITRLARIINETGIRAD
jgi:tripartite-type tricarboxylate transporter receptor subunit TctC